MERIRAPGSAEGSGRSVFVSAHPRLATFVPVASRRHHTFLGVALLLLLGCGRADPPRHLVLVTLDTLRADRLGAYGYGRETSPNFDALALRGVRFDEAITQAVLTPPSHASILTGLNPPAHGLHRLSGEVLAPENRTLAEILAAAGFTTAAFVSARPLRAAQGLAQGFQIYSQPDFRLGSQRRAGRTNAIVERWLKSVSDERIFLWVHYFDPHTPYAAPEDVRARFDLEPDRPSVDSPIRAHADPRKEPGAELVQHMSDLYDAEVAYLDRELGALMEVLEVRGILSDAIVALVADHGENLGERGYYFGHFDLVRAAARVPLVLVHPRGRWRGRVVDARVRTVDLLPTLLGWLGIGVPEGLDGRDLTPLIEGREREARIAYVEQVGYTNTVGVYWDRWVLRMRRPKARRAATGPVATLHRSDEDPDLIHDVRDEQPEVAARLEAALEAALDPAGARPTLTRHVSDLEAKQLRALGYAE